MRPALALGLALALGPVLAGCLAPTATEEALAPAAGYDTSRGWSVPTTPALYAMLDPVKEFVEVADGTPIALGLFFPAVEGCDWEAAELPDACRLPVVMDAGPYYADRVDVDKFRPPTVEWLVPRGYVAVQMSLRGTGESGGCMHFKSPGDVEDVSDVIDALVARPWSNGNVGMIGRSYDGTGAWSGAASGNPHLKAIVPISGAVDAPGLYYKNGTSEARGPIHPATYYPNNGLGLDKGTPDPRPEDVCEDPAELAVESATASATGDGSSDYWRARDLRPLVLEKYRGAAWVIHGLHDWNVNPSQAVPFVQAMQEAGIPTKAWLGVWGHHYPDRVDEHRNVRWDWADATLRFFDHYLKGVGEAPSMDVEVEDSLFVWRREATYPPRDATMVAYALDAGGALVPEEGGARGADLVAANVPATYRSAPLEEDVRIAGLVQFHATVVPSTPGGGHLFAELYDVYPDGRSVRIGWGAINLRYAHGGNEEAVVLAPGQPVVARMEFEPLDALVAKGHALRLVVHKDGVEDVLPSPDPSEVGLATGERLSLLRLPVVDRPSVVPSYVAPGLAE